jgi:hypothetical protein
LKSFGEADADLTALNPGIRPALPLIKQADQISVLNGRLLLAGAPPGPHRIVGITYSAPARMPVANSRATSPSRVKIVTPLPYS